MDPEEEQRLFEESLKKALDEASAKTNTALDLVARSSEGYQMAVWLAAESAEYASLLFSLTNNLEDLDPQFSPAKGVGTLPLVKESAEAIQQVKESTRRDKAEDYRMLRKAVQNLWTAHLDLVKKARKRGRT